MSQRILLLDSGIGNIQSVANVLEHVGANFDISCDVELIKKADKIVFPGVGTYGAAMKNIESRNIRNDFLQAVNVDKKPCLGICVGMQVLSDIGFEFGEHKGLGLISGQVKKISVEKSDLRLPHIGWNSIKINPESKLFRNIPEGGAFYFLHSYCFLPSDPKVVSAQVEYGDVVTAAIEKENIFGVQFHPEKSQDYGIQLFRNFLEL